MPCLLTLVGIEIRFPGWEGGRGVRGFANSVSNEIPDVNRVWRAARKADA